MTATMERTRPKIAAYLGNGNRKHLRLFRAEFLASIQKAGFETFPVPLNVNKVHLTDTLKLAGKSGPLFLVGASLAFSSREETKGLTVGAVTNGRDARVFYRQIKGAAGKEYLEIIEGNRRDHVEQFSPSPLMVGVEFNLSGAELARAYRPFVKGIKTTVKSYEKGEISVTEAETRIVEQASDFRTIFTDASQVAKDVVKFLRRYDSHQYLITTGLPGVHVRIGFPTNKDSLEALNDGIFLIKVAQGAAKAVVEIFSPQIAALRQE